MWASIVASVVGSSRAMQSQDGGGKITRPAYAGRVVRAFDFEEQYTNALPIPHGWIRAQHDPTVPRDRPGFPIWNRATLDYESPAYSGTGSVHLPTAGGSTSLILRHGELTVFPNADYMISARVRTQGLQFARARMVATLIDRAGHVIEGSEVGTKLVRTRGEWELISLFVEGTEPEAAFVRVELELLQPEQQPRVGRAEAFTVWSQDFEGGAWFDDVVVAQVPTIGLSTGTAGNVVVGETAPVLEMTVRDLTGDDLSSYIRVFDASGTLVDQHSSGRGTGTGEGVVEWDPELPGYGWYHAVFDVLSGDGAGGSAVLVGREELDFIWEPERTGGELVGGFGGRRLVPEESSFALRTTSLERNLLTAFPDLVAVTGVKHVEMRAWESGSEATDFVKGSALVGAIDRVIAQGVSVGLSLSEVPMDLADQAAIDRDAIMGLLIEHQPIAMPVLGPFLDRYGQQVLDWRLGIDAIEDDAETINAEVDTIVSMMEPYVPGAVIGVPWAMDRPFELGLSNNSVRLLIEDDARYPEEAMGELIGGWAAAGGGRLDPDGVDATDRTGSRISVIHEPYSIDDGRSGGESVWSRVGWLGRRAISSWWAGKILSPGNDQIEIVLSDPWTVEPGRRGRVMPGPELLVWRTLVDYLGGRGAIEDVDLQPGVRLLLCSGRWGSGDSSASSDGLPNGALIAWLDEPTMERAVIELPLSMGSVEVVDLFGNVREVELEHETELSLPVHRIEVSRTPQIITGVNAELVQFLSSIRLSPDRFEATSGVHKHELVMKNPWPFSIRGRVYIVEPGGYSEPGSMGVDRSWEIKPRVVNFTVAAGMEERVALDVSYSSAKLAGMKDLMFDVELVADQEYGLMRVKREIELGTDLIDVGLVMRALEGDGRSVRYEVEADVGNLTEQPMLVDLVAIAPKNSRRESTISVIDPRESGRRSFVFEGLVSGDEVIISVRVPGHDVQINKAVTVP